MATPITPVPPAEEPITPPPTSEQTTTPTGDAPEQQEQKQYVTQEDLDRRDAELLRRFKQSDRDRTKLIDGKLNEIKGMLDKAGTPLPPEKEAALRNQITDQIDEVEPPQPQEPSAVPPQFQQQVDFLYGQMDDAFQVVGAKVTPNDPEWKKHIQPALDDPKGSFARTLVASTKAAEEKKARTASQQETADARVGGGGSHTPGNAPDDATGLDLLKAAYTK
jgi:hypothetical protein